MNDRQLIGTAFEYAQIQCKSTAIANQMQELISLLTMYERSPKELSIIIEAHQLLKKYSFEYTTGNLQNKLKELSQ